MTIPFLAVGIGDTTVAFLAVGPSIDGDGGGGGGGGGVGMIVPFLSVGTGDATVVFLPVGPSGSADDGSDGDDTIVITGTASGPSYRRNGTDVVNHTFEWVSDASGNATLVSGLPVSGEIERVDFIPSTLVIPDANYDVALTDEDGINILFGQGANLSASVKSTVCPGTPLTDGTTTGTVPVVVDGLLTLNVSNAGDSKAGRVVVYVR